MIHHFTFWNFSCLAYFIFWEFMAFLYFIDMRLDNMEYMYLTVLLAVIGTIILSDHFIEQRCITLGKQLVNRKRNV